MNLTDQQYALLAVLEPGADLVDLLLRLNVLGLVDYERRVGWVITAQGRSVLVERKA